MNHPNPSDAPGESVPETPLGYFLVIVRLAVWFMILTGFSFAFFCVIVVGQVSTDPQTLANHNDLLKATQQQIELLKWIGVPVVAALAAAVGILWRANNAKDKTILDEVKAAQPAREDQLKSNLATREAMGAVVAALQEVQKDTRFCRERRAYEEKDNVTGLDAR